MSFLILVEDPDSLKVIKALPFVPGFAVTMSESHGVSSEVTDFPVEEGVNITDHIRTGPKTLTIEVLLTMTPATPDPYRKIGELETQTRLMPAPYGEGNAPPKLSPGYVTRQIVNALEGRLSPSFMSFQVLKFGDGYEPPRDSWEELNYLNDIKQPMRVVTKLAEYDNMVFTALNATRTPSEGTGSRITMSWKQIRSVETLTVAAPVPEEPRGTKRVSKGLQGASADSGAAGGAAGGADVPGSNQSALLKGALGLADRFNIDVSGVL